MLDLALIYGDGPGTTPSPTRFPRGAGEPRCLLHMGRAGPRRLPGLGRRRATCRAPPARISTRTASTPQRGAGPERLLGLEPDPRPGPDALDAPAQRRSEPARETRDDPRRPFEGSSRAGSIAPVYRTRSGSDVLAPSCIPPGASTTQRTFRHPLRGSATTQDAAGLHGRGGPGSAMGWCARSTRLTIRRPTSRGCAT